MAPSATASTHPLLDVLEREQVGRAAQVERQRPLGEAAEPALEGADVRVVDVAVADVGDGVADDGPAQLVGHLGDGGHLGTPGREQRGDLVLADLLAEQHAFEHLAHRAVPAAPARRGDEDGRLDRRAGVPGGVATADLHDLGAGAGVDGGLDPLGEHRAGVVAAEALGVAAVEHREAQCPGRASAPGRGRARGRS